ncbi:type II toxin-antitoxin system VapC family toxin [Curvibacter sp. CHRR-16]|uniref:type II toxin-antitoxin system VapC family toxin n=1 Tax=Curvibacter sp. CHRR-16 TaxID=2835872 RepID=UPI002023AE30|nr:type II toxin-antitoxin system VapC family toxin [Curvibacter sp. CHRR-16]
MLLDTNVLSEFMRPQPAPQVVAWLNAQNPAQLFISAISRAEIELGLALMPSGQRQQALAKAAQAMFDEDFADQCLVFDALAASHYAQLVSRRTRLGRPISVEDAQIAAIALANAMPLATRNTADFEQIEGLQVVNPWDKSQKEVSSGN